jgi:hypothetical protein
MGDGVFDRVKLMRWASAVLSAALRIRLGFKRTGLTQMVTGCGIQ